VPDYIIAIEQGTNNTRCVVFDHSGNPRAVSQKEHRQIYLLPNRVEQRPLEIWGNVQQTIRDAMLLAGIQKGDLAAAGITNQRETFIVWDRHTGAPFYNAIVWQDTRAKDICENLIADGLQDYVQRRTGLTLSTHFSGPKIKWLLDNVSGVRNAALSGDAFFGTMDTWLIWWLTGGPDGGSLVIDVTNASRTMLMDLETLDWDEDLLKLLTIPRQMLPRIVPSSDAMAWGMTKIYGPFEQKIPVCGDLGNKQAALVGQSCFQPGDIKCSFSTAGFLIQNIGQSPLISKQGLLTTVAYQFGDQPAVYALEGAISIATTLIQWLQDNLGIIRTASEIETLANTVNDSGGVCFLPYVKDLFNPYWGSDSKCVIGGIHPLISKGHLARAALEAIAFQVRRIMDAMKEDFNFEVKELKVSGDMTCINLLMDLLADVLRTPLTRPKIMETAALGAAYAAGLASGFWDNANDLQGNWQEDRRWQPHLDMEPYNQMYRGWLQMIEESYIR
jgi:glycerol kinase